MATLFEARFNDDDVPYAANALIAALEGCEVLVSSITDRIDAALIARLPQSVRLIADDAAQTPRQWSYLVTATSAALLAQGQLTRGRDVIVDNWKHLDQYARDWPTMELLLRVSQPD